MRVLLTGNQGYLGTVMSGALQAAGHEVTGLDSGLFAEQVLGPAPADPPTRRRDVRDVQEADLDGFEAAIHLAALSNDPLGSLEPERTYAINRDASTRLARLAKQAGVRRFLYASTCSVYGAADTTVPVTEDAPLAPLTPYAISKVSVEAELARLADADFVPTSLRNATAFGFSPRLRADIVLNNLVGHAVLTSRVRVLSDGTPWRPLVHAADVAEAFTRMLDADPAVVGARAFNVGDETNNLTVAQIAEIVVDAVPGATLEITGEAGPDPRSYRVDFSALRAALPGFRCRWSAADGARELVDAYTRHGLTTEGFDHDFVRLAVLQRQRGAGRLDDAFRPAA
ncbi:NAD-dependent epimerase/dehydratase family protein [Georgenia alba]|uniref:NAD-dependent epimerase/dehydratase family protein n=1 Tax=Georgenia alba TaxID=2233858 RepID=A0ABW2Q7Q3_9MICO